MELFFFASLDSFLDTIALHPGKAIFLLSLFFVILGNSLRSNILDFFQLELEGEAPKQLPETEEEKAPKETLVENKQEVSETTAQKDISQKSPEETKTSQKSHITEETLTGITIPRLPDWSKKADKEPKAKQKDTAKEKPSSEAIDIDLQKEVVQDKPKKKKRKEKVETKKEKEERRSRTESLQAKRKLHVTEVDLKDSKELEPAKQPKTIKEGLEKTRKGWIARLNNFLLGQKEIDDDLFEELEEILYTADIGTKTIQRLLSSIEDKLEGKELSDPDVVKGAIREEILNILSFDQAELDFTKEKPYVVMVVGVNGAGKTTTIGKVAARLVKEGKKVVIAAGDTFRAAAVDQLEIWCSRVDAELIKGQDKQDPSSVIFDAIKAGSSRDADVILCDTAGRLQTQTNLMEELKKIKRVMGKALPGAPHEVLLVLDATTGQNAVSQAKNFGSALEVSGLALTKLDGTAKGGVVVAISEEMKIPIRFVGVGEHIDELKSFDPKEFVEALL